MGLKGEGRGAVKDDSQVLCRSSEKDEVAI